MPTPLAGAMLSLLFQLEQSQWWEPERLLDRQFAQLNALLSHAVSNVTFYRRGLRKAGAEFSGSITPEEWRKLPLLTRADIQSAGQRLESRASPPSHGKTEEVFSSGTTGSPVRVVQTGMWALYWDAFTIRNQLWHRRDFAGSFASMRNSTEGELVYPEGGTGASWSRATANLTQTGPWYGLNILTPIEQQVEWLQRRQPDYLLTHPTILHELAKYCLEHGIKLNRLRQVETISETLKPGLRELCREAWGVPVVDLYSTRETGYLAMQCPDHDHYHVQAESVYLEILDDHGEPCAPGTIGRVVVTPLHNFAMPLIRYEIGDHAEVGEVCPCGRGLPVIKRILGRTQNMLVMPSGERRWPLLSSANIKGLLEIAPIGRYQFVQTSTSTIEVRLEMARPIAPEEDIAIRDWVAEKFGHPFDVAIKVMDEIPLTASGKFQDFVSNLAP